MAGSKKEKRLSIPMTADLGALANKLANAAEATRSLQITTGVVSPRSRVAADGQVIYGGALSDNAIRELREIASPRMTPAPNSDAPATGKQAPAPSPRTPRGSSAVVKAKGSPRPVGATGESALPAITPRTGTGLLDRLKKAVTPRTISEAEKKLQEEVEAAQIKARKEAREQAKKEKEEKKAKEKQEKKEKKHHRKKAEPEDKREKKEKKEKKHRHKHKASGKDLYASGSESASASGSETESASGSEIESAPANGSARNKKGRLTRTVAFRFDAPPPPPSHPNSSYNTPPGVPKLKLAAIDALATDVPAPLPYVQPPAESIPPSSTATDAAAAVAQNIVRVTAGASAELAASGELDNGEQAQLIAATDQLAVDLRGANSPEVIHAATKRFFDCAPVGVWCTCIGKVLAATLIVLTLTVVGGIACALLGGFLGSLKGGPAFPFTGTAGFFIGLGVGALGGFYAGVNIAAKVVYGKILPPFSCCFRPHTEYQQLTQQLESLDPDRIKISAPIQTV